MFEQFIWALTMLQVDSINTFYGKAQIIFELSLEVSAGEVAVLLGRNGAGKTTTFKSIMGLGPATRGTITFNTNNILGWPPHKNLRIGPGLRTGRSPYFFQTHHNGEFGSGKTTLPQRG